MTANGYALFSVENITAGGLKKIAERYYQVEAVQAVTTGLADGGRGQLRSACGTGKTVMCQRAAELLCGAGELVVILCPSIDLVAQTLREWQETTDGFIALAVCSDETVQDAVATIDSIPATVTTQVDDVAGWLRTPAGSQLRLIVGTHQSSHVVGDALIATGRQAHLLIVDEAHRTAGVVDKHTALVHDDSRLPAHRRLYATATPKVVGEKLRGQDDAALTRVVGMDDERVFGPVLYNYPFSQAIKDGYLDDYRLVVMGVTRSEMAEYLATVPRTASGGGLPTSVHTAMVQTVLAKAARQYGFRRALTFCSRINEARDFARTMRATMSVLPAEMKPQGALTAAYVDGGMKSADRRKRLQQLVHPPKNGWTVVTNVRCLAEGVDVPAIDAVAFTHPKQSYAEIVQAIGRALRRDPSGSGIATILVPILLPDTPEDEDAHDAIDVADYRLLWQVLRALRDHDDKFGADADQTRSRSRADTYSYDEQPLEHVIINLPPDYDNGAFLSQLTAKIITTTGGSWWNNFALLKQFYGDEGHVIVPRDHVVYDQGRKINVKLGVWCDNVRTSYRKGILSQDRINALEDLGFDFQPDAVDWALGLRAATKFFEEEGHLEPVRTRRVLGVELRSWLEKHRVRAANGELDASRRQALNALRMRWRGRPKTFEDYIAALADYRAQHGHIDIAPEPGTDDGYLGNWLIKMRIRRRMGELTKAEIEALDALGIDWSRRKTSDTVTESRPSRSKRSPAPPSARRSGAKAATSRAPSENTAPPAPAASRRPAVSKKASTPSVVDETPVRESAKKSPTATPVPQFQQVAAVPATTSPPGAGRIVKPPLPLFQPAQD